MEYFLPDAAQAGLNMRQRRSQQDRAKLSVHIEGHVIPVTELTRTGFAVDKRYRFPQKARVEIYDGSRSIYFGLVHYADEEAELQHFEFKQRAPARAHAPKDYAEGETHIVGLIAGR